jgi:hypothetical protein
MTSIEITWASLENSGDVGGARRVDDKHPCDFYAALDAAGRRGLVLVTATAPPTPALFDAVDLTISHRADGRWNLGIWLQANTLSSLFGRLCYDLVESSRDIMPSGAAGYILSRLVRWRKLLQAGNAAPLLSSELRGLMGELTVLRYCLDFWSAGEVIRSWVGPLDAPQDFTLPSLRIEAKAIRPGAPTVKISSVDQLDVPDAALLLSVVTLAPVEGESDEPSLAQLVDGIREWLFHEGAHGAILEFESRLAAGGYTDLAEYHRPMFRVEAVRFFEVCEDFPRLRRADLPKGVAGANYEIELGNCTSFETDLSRWTNGA